MTATGYRLGEFAFDPASGELSRPRAGGGGTEVRRLAPQPARLLALLAANGGEVVTREAIREALWPDVRVEFDQGLHFCMRQVRAALGDRAQSPRYVETIPRRGYRLLVPVEEVERQEAVTARPRDRRRVRLAVAAAIALAAVVVTVAAVRTATRPPALVRVAILPFRPPEGFPIGRSHAGVAERILLGVDRAGGGRLELVGPTTTGAYGADAASMSRLVADLGVDYLVNGRYLSDPAPALFAEVIRASDGVHLWVRAFDPQEDPQTIVETVTDAVTAIAPGNLR